MQSLSENHFHFTKSGYIHRNAVPTLLNVVNIQAQQHYSILLTAINNVDTTVLVNPAFINHKHVDHFRPCINVYLI